MEKVEHKLSVNIFLWLILIKDLKKRGRGNRESGAFLLARPNDKRVIKYICFDDLDPNCLNGEIEFDASGFIKLSKICKEKNLKVIADIHTHPSAWTEQSEVDIRNPMVGIKGHLAFIVPFYATKFLQLLTGVGIFEYMGSYNWLKHEKKIIKITVL